MTWYYAAEGNQIGPFTDEQFRDLIATGKIQPGTLVWQQKLANWIPLAQVPPELFPPAPVAPPSDPTQPPLASALPRCSNCGGEFPADNLVQIEDALVCPACKPIVLHRIKEGFDPLRTAFTPEQLIHRVTSENRIIDVGNCFSRAWELLKADFGPMIGVAVMVFGIMMAGGVIPFIGSCISLVITGPLMGGLYFYYLKRLRGEPALVGDGFAGFKINFSQLMLASIVTSILAYLPLVPFIIYMFANNAGSRGGQFNFGVVDVVLGIFGFLAMMYLFMAWMFTIPLVIDKNLNFWTAMTVSRQAATKRLGSVILLMLASAGVSILGVLACGVGILLALPIVFTAYAAAYNDLFGERSSFASAAIPNA